ncbi:hypothetical protein BKM31_57420 [[Actinomadura] parvosata subsp. kistnae]|uniref:Uncharacterized protein n=2 Tax=Nonomuraea TaxID=83681 RepID=A0A1V0AHV8_9ACTN|nr:hypothetical protein BKM31_57420 [Nonomuraea sp. ATCC 55076]
MLTYPTQRSAPEGTMTPEQPGPQQPDPNQTIRHRHPHPGQPDDQGPPDAPSTRRLPYTPDMLPDVPLYETKPPRSGWWWVIVVGGLVLLLAAVAVAAILWVRSATADSGTGALRPAAVTLA